MDNLKPGHTVEFHGLKGAAHLNGTTGHLVKFIKKEQRWAVRCDSDNQVVNAKPENLKRVESAQQRLTNMFASSTVNRAPAPAPDTSASSSHGDVDSLHETVLDSFYTRRKGGVVVSYGDSFMLAVEFDGSYGSGGFYGEMVYVDKNPQARAVVQARQCARATELGRNFLLGETVEYIEATDETAFFSLLSKYKRGSSTQGLIDLKSGLKLYNTKIAN